MKKVFIGLITLMMLYYAAVSESTPSVIFWKEHKDLILTDRYTLQKIFTGRITRWPNGEVIRVYIKPRNSIEHREFVQNVLGLTTYQYNQLQELNNAKNNVSEVYTDYQMILKIEQIPGSIGYINYDIYSGNKQIVILEPDNILY